MKNLNIAYFKNKTLVVPSIANVKTITMRYNNIETFWFH